MAIIGAAKTRKFALGSSELRIGPLTSAGRLRQVHSIGLVDSVVLNIEQQVIELKGGFPQQIIDAAVADQNTTITATCREFSRRNLGIMLNQGLSVTATNDPIDDATTTLSAATTAGATTISLVSATGFANPGTVVDWDGWVSIYEPNSIGECVITRITSIAGTTATLDAAFPVGRVFPAGSVVAKLVPVKIGGAGDGIKYFTAQLVQQSRSATGDRPTIFNFWKCMNSGSMNLTQGSSDYGSTDMVLKVLVPAFDDYSVSGQGLYHLKDLLPKYPIGMMGITSDDSTVIPVG